jgi:hypothetical protein
MRTLKKNWLQYINSAIQGIPIAGKCFWDNSSNRKFLQGVGSSRSVLRIEIRACPAVHLT